MLGAGATAETAAVQRAASGRARTGAIVSRRQSRRHGALAGARAAEQARGHAAPDSDLSQSDDVLAAGIDLATDAAHDRRCGSLLTTGRAASVRGADQEGGVGDRP